MLKNKMIEEKPQKEELKERLDKVRNRLAVQQMAVKEHKLPVIVLVEGWGTAGKGSMIGKIINNIDPRFFKVASLERIREEDLRKPFLWRYFTEIPEAGNFVFMDSGWMEEVTRARAAGEMDDKTYESRIASIRHFERQLVDNGYLVVKFFLHISEKEQKKRIEALHENEDTDWRINNSDFWQNKHYNKYFKVYDEYLDATDSSTAPWYVIDASSKKWAELQMLEFLTEGIDIAMQNHSLAVPLLQNTFALQKMPKLAEISLLDKTISDEEYKVRLKELQEQLRQLHNRIYRAKIPVIIAYEGWDAAGKGGNIKRIAEALDPRGYVVQPIASPLPHEKSRHFLWRFYTRLPRTGHIAIFDRTWYGRVMVERIEGFCKENDWKRAYNEINEFEKDLADWGAVIIKFWVHIDKDTQLERFTMRQNTPEKQWKITDEDWRNREKWDAYESAIDEMIQKTSTTFAPWHILESVDKKYARIKALEIVVDELEKALKEKEKK